MIQDDRLNISASNGFCGFRYDPQMNADERRQTLTDCAAGHISVHPRSSAVCRDHSCLKSYAATKSVRIRNIYTGEGLIFMDNLVKNTYDQDFYAWTMKSADLIRHGRWEEPRHKIKKVLKFHFSTP